MKQRGEEKKKRREGRKKKERKKRGPTNAKGAEDCLLPSWSTLSQCKAVSHEPLYVPHLFLFTAQTCFIM